MLIDQAINFSLFSLYYYLLENFLTPTLITLYCVPAVPIEFHDGLVANSLKLSKIIEYCLKLLNFFKENIHACMHKFFYTLYVRRSF